MRRSWLRRLVTFARVWNDEVELWGGQLWGCRKARTLTHARDSSETSCLASGWPSQGPVCNSKVYSLYMYLNGKKYVYMNVRKVYLCTYGLYVICSIHSRLYNPFGVALSFEPPRKSQRQKNVLYGHSTTHFRLSFRSCVFFASITKRKGVEYRARILSFCLHPLVPSLRIHTEIHGRRTPKRTRSSGLTVSKSRELRLSANQPSIYIQIYDLCWICRWTRNRDWSSASAPAFIHVHRLSRFQPRSPASKSCLTTDK